MSTRRARTPVTGKSKAALEGKSSAVIGRTVALDGKPPGNGKTALDGKPTGNGKGALDGRSPVNGKAQAIGPTGDRPPSPWRASRERQHDREVKRDAVIRAAAHAFNHKGYHNTSLDDIAAALEVTKPTVYYYVTNKEQLLFECFVAGVEQIRAGFREARDQDIPARERLQAVLRHYAKAMASEFGWCMVRVEDQDLSPDMSSHIKAMKSEIDQGIRRLIREGVQDGSIHPCDPKMTAFALAGSLNWIAHWYRENKSMSGAEIADAFITVFDNGLQPRRGARS
jgi:AcrR family transcriptional regulator